MDSKLKTSHRGRFSVQLLALVSQIKSVKTDFGSLFSFKTHLILFPYSSLKAMSISKVLR